MGIKIFILNSIGGQITIDSHWFMKDEEAIDWREGFSTTSIGQGKKAQGRIMESLGEKSFLVFCVFIGKGKRMNV